MRREFRPGDEPIPGLRLVANIDDSSVWRAVDAGRPVVVRFLNLGSGPRAADRARALADHAALRHPNLVPIEVVHLFEAFGLYPTAAVVMPPADGSLADRLVALPDGLPADGLLPLFAGAAAALDFLHFHRSAGPIRHGRLKPSKLLLAGGWVWVSDFARPDPNDDNPALVRSADSPVYAAQEVIRNRPVPASDRYALALLYYEARTGRLPFPDALTLMEVLMAHAQGELVFNAPGVTDAEVQVLRWATALDPAARYPTCGEFIAELERAVAGRTPRSPDELQRPR